MGQDVMRHLLRDPRRLGERGDGHVDSGGASFVVGQEARALL